MSYLDKYYNLSNKKYKTRDEIYADHIGRLEALMETVLKTLNCFRIWIWIFIVLFIVVAITACQPVDFDNYNIFTGWEQIGG